MNNKVKTVKLKIEIIISLITSSVIILRGEIPKKPEKTVKPQVNNNVSIMASVNLKIEIGNFEFSLFLVLDKVNNKMIPQIPVPTTHKVELCSLGISSYLVKSVTIKIFKVTVNPVGKALAIMFFRKLPCMRSVLGSKASKKEGIPMVITLIRLN